jgi:hypothetical protein
MVVFQKGKPLLNTGFVRKLDLGHARREENSEWGDGYIDLGNY